nr:cytochrome c oxidase subunit 7A2, mitochondrial [Anser cygnoides]
MKVLVFALDSQPVLLTAPFSNAESANLRQISQRTISTASRRQLENRVPEKQKLFQEDNGLPVYLKGGAMDGLLYRVTMGLSVFGTGYVLYELMVASMPKKQK